LEQKGLVRRARTSPDRRIIIIELAEAGKRLAQTLSSRIPPRMLDGLTMLPETEIKQIVKSLMMLTHMLEVSHLDEE
jgi:DNA-binding MarR family transcriptional regulator